MKIVQNTIYSRSFLIQCMEIERIFGNVIPWLCNLRTAIRTVNRAAFHERLQKDLGNTNMRAYSFIETGREGLYCGGLWHLEKSPEEFSDANNSSVQQDLSAAGYSYISCLHVVSEDQNKRLGESHFSRALHAILQEYEKVWGVVSNYSLLPFYQRFGAEIINEIANADKLAIITFTQQRYCRRH